MSNRATTAFGALLKRYRLTSGLTQEALAERAGISTRAVSDLERGGGRLPRLETVSLLVEALGLTPEQSAVLRAAARPVGVSQEPAPIVTAVAHSTSTFTPPETHYARSGEVSVAYQVVGHGPVDLVLTPGFVSHLEWLWEHPAVVRFYRRLASFSRLILFDKRGTGLSDRIAGGATLEERIDDIHAVMDAVGSRRAVILGVSEGAPMAALFAATHPDRTQSLVLYGGEAVDVRQPDYPWAPPAEEAHRWVETMASTVHQEWGQQDRLTALLEKFAPTMAHDDQFVRWFGTLLRMGASPGARVAILRMNLEIDVRQVLPAIHVPTLVLHRTGDQPPSIEESHYLAAHIPGARFVELPGVDHLPFVGEMDALVDEVERFVTGGLVESEPDRVLATILRAELVGTERVPNREEYDALVRSELARHRGRPMVISGDGVGAAFDGPGRAVRCAQAIVAGARRLGLTARTGLHVGECEPRGDEVHGFAVELAAHTLALAAPGEVVVTSTVKELVAGSNLEFEDRGVQTCAGIRGEWHFFAVR